MQCANRMPVRKQKLKILGCPHARIRQHAERQRVRDDAALTQRGTLGLPSASSSRVSSTACRKLPCCKTHTAITNIAPASTY